MSDVYLCRDCGPADVPIVQEGDDYYSYMTRGIREKITILLDGERVAAVRECVADEGGWLVRIATDEEGRPRVCEVCEDDVAEVFEQGNVAVIVEPREPHRCNEVEITDSDMNERVFMCVDCGAVRTEPFPDITHGPPPFDRPITTTPTTDASR